MSCFQNLSRSLICKSNLDKLPNKASIYFVCRGMFIITLKFCQLILLPRNSNYSSDNELSGFRVLLEKYNCYIRQKQATRDVLLKKACNFIKKETLAQVLSCEFCEISKNTFSTGYLRTTASLTI